MGENPIRTETDASGGRRTWSERVQGAIMVAVLLFGAWQGVAAIMTPAAQRRLAGVLDGPAVLAGRTAAAINFIEAHYLPADGILRAAGGVLRWRLFKSGGPQVAVGCNDWLYLTEELRPWPDADANMRARADILRRMAAKLKEQDVALLVAVVPDKSRVEAASLCDVRRAAQAEARYAAFAALLREREIPAADLLAPLSAARRDGPVYYRTDTHWNQAGAALAARTIAGAVTASLDRDYEYRTDRDAAETDGPGDLLRLMSLDKVPDTTPRLRPAPDRQQLERTVQTKAPEDTGGLLDSGPGGQVVLLGSSYSQNANFHGRLQEALRLPVGNFAELGGGFASAARTYFKGGAFADSPPKLVIWEIPERVVGQPLDAADRALMEE